MLFFRGGGDNVSRQHQDHVAQPPLQSGGQPAGALVQSPGWVGGGGPLSAKASPKQAKQHRHRLYRRLSQHWVSTSLGRIPRRWPRASYRLMHDTRGLRICFCKREVSSLKPGTYEHTACPGWDRVMMHSDRVKDAEAAVRRATKRYISTPRKPSDRSATPRG